MTKIPYKYRLLIFFVLIGFCIAYFLIDELWPITGEKRYTIGTVNSIAASGGGVRSTNYSYKVRGKMYSSFSTVYGFIDEESYLVVFSVRKPRKSRLLLDKKIDIDLIPPDSGWVEIPKELISK